MTLRFAIRIFFEKIETEAEKVSREAQIKVLEASIARREKLLANENYVKKAPEKIVEMDRKKSFIAAMIGIFMASIIMMLISFGLLKTIIG